VELYIISYIKNISNLKLIHEVVISFTKKVTFYYLLFLSK